MNELEKGYVHIDDNGNVQFVSYDTVGGGLFMIALLVLATVFITDISTYIASNRWIVIIPTLIAVLIRTIIFDKGLPIYKRLLNVLSDTIKTICMYGVLIVVLDKIATAHWLDRVLFAVFYGAILFIVYFLLSKFVFTMLRTCQLCVLHIVASIVVAAICLFIYFGHTWYWMGYDYKTSFNGASIVKVDKRMEGDIEIPEKINNYIINSIGERAFSSNEKITSVKLPSGLEIIEERAFSWNDTIESVEIPLSVKTIQEKAFDSASALTDIYYEGTEADWNKINIQDDSIANMQVHFSK